MVGLGAAEDYSSLSRVPRDVDDGDLLQVGLIGKEMEERRRRAKTTLKEISTRMGGRKRPTNERRKRKGPLFAISSWFCIPPRPRIISLSFPLHASVLIVLMVVSAALLLLLRGVEEEEEEEGGPLCV